MKTIYKICIAAAWGTICLIAIPPIVTSCSSDKDKIEDRVIDEGLLRNDDLIAVKTSDGKVTIKNARTGKVTIKDVKLDWTQESSRDSLAVFCSEKKRGYYNMYTGEIAVPAQYRRAWVFAEGVAAVQKNGMIGFIDHKGNTVIDFQFPYHGNPLTEFVFSEGHCVVADTLGKCGVIDKKGHWLIKPEYDNISVQGLQVWLVPAGIAAQMDSRHEYTADDEKIPSFN